MKRTVSYISWLLSEWIFSFSHHFLVSQCYVQSDFWPFTFTYQVKVIPDTRNLWQDKRTAIAVISIWVISALISLIRLFIPKNMYVVFIIIFSTCIINVTFLNFKHYLTLRCHINQNQVLQVAQTGQRESVQRKRKSAMSSLFVYLIFIVCYLPHICSLFIIAAISKPRIDVQHLQFYTITLPFLNSTLNPLIYCWKMKQIRNTIMNKLQVLWDGW